MINDNGKEKEKQTPYEVCNNNHKTFRANSNLVDGSPLPVNLQIYFLDQRLRDPR